MKIETLLPLGKTDPGLRVSETPLDLSRIGADARLVEEMGFDGIWAVEHHSLVEYSHMSAPEIFLSAVAANTSRIRIGHAAVCMPFPYNHPNSLRQLSKFHCLPKWRYW